jgi:hypothetical protein
MRMISNVDWELNSMTVRLKAEHNDKESNRQFEAFEVQYVTGLPNLVYL